MLQIKCSAKINLALSIVGKRPDGYHELDMLMQSVSLYDYVMLQPSSQISISCNFKYIPTDERNIAYRAAQVFFKALGSKDGVDIVLKKRIPSQAGLGGGSSDCAGVLLGLNHLYKNPFSIQHLKELGLTLGADVPFFFDGGCQRAQGVGEILSPISNRLKAHFLLVKPKKGVKTNEAFALYAKMPHPASFSIDQCILALSQGNLPAFCKATGNNLLEPAMSLCSQIKPILDDLKKAGALGAFMSGSGSTCFGVFAHGADCKQAYRHFLSRGDVMVYECRALPQSLFLLPNQ